MDSVTQIVPKCADDICGMCDLIGLANNIIQFAIYLAVTIAAIMFIVAGIKYLTAGGDSAKISAAHKIFFNVIIGLALVLTAWLIIELIMTTFLGTSFGGGVWNKPVWCS